MPTVVANGFGWRPHGRQPILRDLSLRIEPGERILLTGPSGAGKSTLLAALAGVLSTVDAGETHGQLLVDGRDASVRAHAVGLVRQDPETNVLLGRVDDELRFGAENLGVAPKLVAHRADAVRRLIGDDIAPQRATSSLSGGQKQRLAIAAVAAMRPQLWLLDEPTAQLDPAGAERVSTAVADLLAADDTLIVVDHLPARWWSRLTRVIALDRNGQVVFDGSPETALTDGRSMLSALGTWLPDVPAAVPPLPPAATSAVILAAERLEYGRERTLGTLTVEICAAQSTILRGPNGSGKTTLALTLAGLLRPRAGALTAALSWAPQGRRSQRAPHTWSDRDLAARIATVFQQPDLQFLRPTVAEEIQLGARSADDAFALIDRLELTHTIGMNPRALSGGEKRRLSVATALASPAQLIVADEPTFGQDRHTWQLLITELQRAQAAGRSLVLPSHDDALGAALGAHEVHIGDSTVERDRVAE